LDADPEDVFVDYAEFTSHGDYDTVTDNWEADIPDVTNYV